MLDTVRQNKVYAIARVTLAGIWLYLAIFPKFIFVETVELQIIRESGMFPGNEMLMLFGLGLVEISLALGLLIFWHNRCIFGYSIVFLVLLTIMSGMIMPGIFREPFNPATMSVPMIALATVGFVSAKSRHSVI